MSAGDPARALRVALAQMRGGLDVEANLAAAEDAVAKAADEGARLVLTPEATNIVQRDGEKLLQALREGDDELAVVRLSRAAARHRVWLLAGSLMVSAGDGRAANRSYLFDDQGGVVATYDKIHLFDVDIGSGESYRESRTVAPGGRAVVAQTPWGRLGLSICYDLRFAKLYRALAQAGAAMIAVPAAFTRPTGAAHWETLLRARAIETGAYVLAPAQGGVHADGRATWGRSSVVAPWGEVVAKLDHDEPGVLIADLDLGLVEEARGRIPSLRNDRDFAAP